MVLLDMYRVFGVDDDIVLRELVKSLTRALDLEVFFFDNPYDMVAYMDEYSEYPIHLPDIVFLEIATSSFNMWKILDELGKFYNRFSKEVAVYIVSSSVSAADLTKAQSYAFVKEFIPKPLSEEKFITLRRSVKHRRLSDGK